jgi:hypothetical protein
MHIKEKRLLFKNIYNIYSICFNKTLTKNDSEDVIDKIIELSDNLLLPGKELEILSLEEKIVISI